MFILIILQLALANALMLRPPCADFGVASVLLFGGGAGLGPKRYVPLFDKTQQSACALGLRLWIGSPKFFADNWATQGQFENNMAMILTEIEADLRANGVADIKEVRVFYGGHSRGGIAAQDLVKNVFGQKPGSLVLMNERGDGDAVNEVFKRFSNGGLVLFSSALQRKYRSDHKGVFLYDDYPILTLSGELDGLFRVFRLAEAFYHTDNEGTSLTAVIPGGNHMSFASGNAPLFVKLNDLRSEISQDRAHTYISDLVYSFIFDKVADPMDAKTIVAKTVLQNTLKQSATFFDPIIQSFKLEGSYHLKPACNEIPAGDARDCWKGSPWTEEMQVKLANLPEVDIKVTDAFWKVWLINPVHLPDIKNNCSSVVGCHLEMTTVTQCTYGFVDLLDTGFSSVACEELRAKMKSRQVSHIAAGIKNASFKDLDDNNKICRQLNDASIEWAVANADKKALKRFREHGVPLRNGDDLGPFNAGPSWIWKGLQFKKQIDPTDNSTFVEVNSPTMRTPDNYFIKLSAGFHYCKLLSPARALEWIYIDSLKQKN